MLRLFLSVDIQGSTNQKNNINYSTLYDDYINKSKIFRNLLKGGFINLPTGKDEEVFIEELILESIANTVQEREYLDWLESQSNLFQDFNTQFIAFLSKNYNEHLSDSDSEKFLWKSIGDELVYVFEVKNRNEVHNICLSFLAAVYFVDQKLSQANYYRLKASAWTAGFPIRNREIQFPFPKTYVKMGDLDEYTEYNYPQLDFIGPDIDIGFRLGKFCWPGMMAVSMDLAQLLAESTVDEKLTVRFVGWENLKGVWNNIPYPIFWVKLDKNQITSQRLKEYKCYNASDVSLSRNLEKFDQNKATGYIDEDTQNIAEIRKELPDFLGLVKPYFEDEHEAIPSQHQKIKELIKSLEVYKKVKKRETEAESNSLPNNTENIDSFIEDKFKNKFDQSGD